MTFDDILKSGDLFDGVWDTQRLTSALEDTVSAATQKNRTSARRPWTAVFGRL